MDAQVYKSDLIFTKNDKEFTSMEQAYLVVENGKVLGVFDRLPGKYESIPLKAYESGFLIPGFVDLHLHAPQYENLGIGLDEELLTWLNKYAFPEEARFSDAGYAEEVYKEVVRRLWENGTTRSVIFGTAHKGSTEILLRLMKKSGLGAYVGKVNMDRNSSQELTEDTERSLEDTEAILDAYRNERLVKPIITPRFVPSCSPRLMEGLGRLAEKYDAPVQSHLSENTDEVEWVKELHPDCESYAHVYERYGLLRQNRTIMAHCVYCTGSEKELMREKGVFAAHCPISNTDLTSGIAPVKDFIAGGVNLGLGSDISGGHTLWMPEVLVHAIQVSKLYYLYKDKDCGRLTLPEAFYLATKGGGSFFGKVGSFEEDYSFDALLIDDCAIIGQGKRSLEERLQKFIYTGEKGCIIKRFVEGNELGYTER